MNADGTQNGFSNECRDPLDAITHADPAEPAAPLDAIAQAAPDAPPDQLDDAITHADPDAPPDEVDDAITHADPAELLADAVTRIDPDALPDKLDGDLTAPPAPSGDLAPGADLTAPPRRRPRRALLAVAFAMSLASVAAYICAGIFVADAVMARGARLFAGELAAVAETEGAAIEAIRLSPETADTPPAETEPAAEAPAEPKTYPVESADMSCADVLAIANETGYSPDVAAIASAQASAFATPPRGEPTVLVIHTHSTEAYLPEGTKRYGDDTSFSSLDPRENMIAVGDALCLALGELGIRCVHCTENFDAESFIHSYEKSAEAVGRYIAKDPSIRYVLDVHRDAIFRADGTLLAPRTADGAAQIMIVCGTDEMGADFPDWRDNLAFAFAIRSAAWEKYPDLMRNVNLRGASFNEQLAERYLLVEIGSAGNTLAEAKLAAERFAEVFAAVVGAANK